MKQMVLPVLMTCVSALSGCADPTTNISAAILRDLYKGNVKVSHEPQWKGINGTRVRASYFDGQGNYLSCSYLPSDQSTKVTGGKWVVVTDEKYGALFGTDREGKGFDPNQRRGFYPIQYNSVTGAMKEMSYDSGSWSTSRVSHFQETWPASMAERCPSIKLPVTVKINEKQTSEHYDKLVAQDPSAIIKR